MRAKSDVKFTMEEISPALAEKYLDANKLNRPLRPGGVERYALDMKTGNWGETHQAIAFDVNGNILDGQDRQQDG